jgi:hypothetical protein
MSLLSDRELRDIPFLVLETAKKDYRKLLNSDVMDSPVDFYTPGSEGVVPIRLNPFELLPGVRVEYHIGALQTCFEAAIPLVGPLFAILEEALVSVYTELGWNLGEARPKTKTWSKRFPTMTLFAARLRQIAEKRGYSDDTQSDVSAAIAGRINPMTLASGTSKGRMLDCLNSYPSMESIFLKNTVLELNDLRHEDKAFVTMLVLVFLREYREVMQDQREESKGLTHVTVVEEAHNVLSNFAAKSGEDSPNTRFAAVERFSNMLTEMRSLGEGLIIADQSPHKILPDAIRNTNLQIVHQLRAKEDREAMASSMVMSDLQKDFLAKLACGHAAVYFSGVEGLERATFTTFPNPKKSAEQSERKIVGDSELRNLMSAANTNNRLLKALDEWPMKGCLLCPERGSCPSKKKANQICTLDVKGTGMSFMDSVIALLGNTEALDNVSKAFERSRIKLGVSPSKSLFWCAINTALEISTRPSQGSDESVIKEKQIILTCSLVKNLNTINDKLAGEA